MWKYTSVIASFDEQTARRIVSILCQRGCQAHMWHNGLAWWIRANKGSEATCTCTMQGVSGFMRRIGQ